MGACMGPSSSAYSQVPVFSSPSVVRTLPGASDVVSGPFEVCTLPSASDLGSMPSTAQWEHTVGGWVERRLELLLQENSPNCPLGSFSF